MSVDRVAGCYSCDQEPVGEHTRPSERVWVGTHWRVVHAIHCALPGWLVLVPRRHVEAIADLTPDEAVELGSPQCSRGRWVIPPGLDGSRHGARGSAGWTCRNSSPRP